MSEAAIKDMLRDMARRLRVVECASAQTPARHAVDPPARLAYGTVRELIDAAGSGEVLLEGRVRTLTNPDNNALWVGTRVLVQSPPGLILLTNAATILQAEYNSGTKTLLDSYGLFSAASTGHFDDEDVDHVESMRGPR